MRSSVRGEAKLRCSRPVLTSFGAEQVHQGGQLRGCGEACFLLGSS